MVLSERTLDSQRAHSRDDESVQIAAKGSWVDQGVDRQFPCE
jgi:hypothetical protein